MGFDIPYLRTYVMSYDGCDANDALVESWDI